MALKKLDETKYSIPTRLIYGKSIAEEWDYSHHVIPPISASSTFRLDSASRGAEGFDAVGNLPDIATGEAPIYIYPRMSEPNNAMLAHVLATAEQSEIAVTFGSGMAAVNAAVLCALNPGSEIISHKVIYGCTYSLFTESFKRFGIKTTFADLTKPDSFLEHVTANTRILYLESPSNPTLELLDLDAIVKLVKKINKNREDSHKLLTVIDNTFATPFAQRPATHGVDIIVHSLTKGLSGFGTVMGGAVITRSEFQNRLILFRKDFGGLLMPMTAWNILHYGVPTLSLRIPRQQESALEIAKYLENHKAVSKVRYPGLPSFPQAKVARRMLRDYKGKFAPGFMIYFALKGKTATDSRNRGRKMMDFIAENAYTITLAVSLGQLRTLIEHPGSMTHSAYSPEEQLRRGIDPGGIRLSVGIEEPEDIIRDLEIALKKVS